MVERHHQYTGILLIVFVILILLGAIFFTVAQTRVRDFAEYKAGNAKLRSANNNLTVAYVLGYIAAAIGILLAILYFGHTAWQIKNETIHLILFILLFALVIVSGIFGIIALNDIDQANPPNKNNATNWIWAALVSGLIALILIIISGAWRAQYRSTLVPVVPEALPMETVTTTTTYRVPTYPAPVLHAVAPALPSSQVYAEPAQVAPLVNNGGVQYV